MHLCYTKKTNRAEVKESTKKKIFKVDEEKLRRADEYVSQQLTLIEYELTDIKQAILCSLTRLRGIPTAYNVRVKELPEQIKKEEPIKSLIGRLDKFLEVSKFSAAALDILIHSDAFSIEIDK